MIFDLIKSIIWISGLLVLAYFSLGFFDYEINSDYFTYSKKTCEEKLRECGGKVIQKGSLKCDFKCVEPDLIIKKKQ